MPGLGTKRKSIMVGIPREATAAGRVEQVRRDGEVHEHSYQQNVGVAWAWRAITAGYDTRLCGTERCFRLPVRNVVESEA